MARTPAAGDIWSLKDGPAERGMVLIGRTNVKAAATVPVTDNVTLAGECSPIISAGRSHTGRPLLILFGQANYYRLDELGSCLIEAAVTAEQAGWMVVEQDGTHTAGA